MDLDRWRAVSPLLDEALRITAQASPDSDPPTFLVLNRGNLYLSLARYDAAIVDLERAEAVAQLTAAIGPEHPQTRRARAAAQP